MYPDSPRKGGFSLIEVIAAMSVLAIIMLLISQAYTSVNGAWRDGMIASDQNSGGRSVLAFMARELSQAIADDQYQMVVKADDSAYSVYGTNDSAIWFSTLSGRPRHGTSEDYRQVQDISYYVTTDGGGSDRQTDFAYRKLRRIGNYKLDKLAPYKNGAKIDAAISKTGSDLNGGSDLLPFVHRFEITLYCQDLANPGGPPVARAISDPRSPHDYKSYATDGITQYVPAYADLYLEVLGHDIAQSITQLTSSEKKEFAKKNVQRFSTRVYFPNIAGRNRSST